MVVEQPSDFFYLLKTSACLKPRPLGCGGTCFFDVRKINHRHQFAYFQIANKKKKKIKKKK